MNLIEDKEITDYGISLYFPEDGMKVGLSAYILVSFGLRPPFDKCP